MRIALFFGRFTVTAIVVVLAVFVGWRLWVYYMEAPWTRDGHVRADVVGVAPDVSGLVSDVLVHDNETVTKGQTILRIDPARFAIALRMAEATVASRRAALVEAVREANRSHQLTSLSISQAKLQQDDAARDQAAAAYEQAMADRDLAALNLERAEVKAPVSGIITNFDMQPGNYVAAGKAITALIDTSTTRVEGYFEETKLHGIHVGAPVSVWLMGEKAPLQGHVESISGGIVDRERDQGGSLLANINPTFSWIRLAQRIPVRIKLDNVRAILSLIPGRTATVTISEQQSSPTS